MDPIADMLNMIKNAGRGTKDVVVVPFSTVKQSIANCLLKEGYIAGAAKKTRDEHPVLELSILRVGGVPKINDILRVSKPSRRVYYAMKDIRPIRYGHGRVFLSTPKGIMTGEQARKEQVGGEALFKIW